MQQGYAKDMAKAEGIAPEMATESCALYLLPDAAWSRRVSGSFGQLDTVTQQNAALVEENAATAKTLEHQAKAMDEQVAVFRIAASHDIVQATSRTELAEQVRHTYEAMAGPQEDFDYFVNWALARRMLTMVVVLARGSAALGLRPGLEGMLRQQMPYVQMVTRILQERTGVRLPGVEPLLAE